MADLRQCVVFGQHGDGRAGAGAAGDGGLERRFNAADAALYLEAVLLQEPGQGVGGIEFLVVQFGMGVDVFGEVEQLLFRSLDGRVGTGGERVFGYGFSAGHVVSLLGSVVKYRHSRNTIIPEIPSFPRKRESRGYK